MYQAELSHLAHQMFSLDKFRPETCLVVGECRSSTRSWSCAWSRCTCCAVLCCAVLCCAVLCCAVLCCAVLCCAVLCCAVLCCAVLCCICSQLLHSAPSTRTGCCVLPSSTPTEPEVSVARRRCCSSVLLLDVLVVLLLSPFVDLDCICCCAFGRRPCVQECCSMDAARTRVC